MPTLTLPSISLQRRDDSGSWRHDYFHRRRPSAPGAVVPVVPVAPEKDLEKDGAPTVTVRSTSDDDTPTPKAKPLPTMSPMVEIHHDEEHTSSASAVSAKSGTTTTTISVPVTKTPSHKSPVPRAPQFLAAPVLNTVSNGSSVSVATSATSEAGTFTPMPYYIGLSDLPSVCRPRETLLVFKETKNMLMGSSYELRESQGDVIIHIRAHAVTLHDSKDVLSSNGDKLFILKHKLAAVRRTFEGTSPDGKHLFVIRRKSHGSAECKFTNLLLTKATEAHEAAKATISLRGNFYEGLGELVFTQGDHKDLVVAKVRRHPQKMKEEPDFYVKVAAGVDLALIATICLCFDHLINDKGLPKEQHAK